MSTDTTNHLIIGGTGFVGQQLTQRLRSHNERVIATSRRAQSSNDDVQWRVCDLTQPDTVVRALKDIDIVYYLAHSMGGKYTDYRERERRSAKNFVRAADESQLRRVVYLGGPKPDGEPSEHLRSRLEVGEILRSGSVPTVELRASMVIGRGSVSWQIVRDLSLRLPMMILPRWLRSRTYPVALEDVLVALEGAAKLDVRESTVFDIPGPEELTGREILERVAACRRRKIAVVEVPLLTPRLSALWLRLVTSADYSVAKELVQGLENNLIPQDDRFWNLIGHDDLLGFDEAVRRALDSERGETNRWERFVQRLTSRSRARAED